MLNYNYRTVAPARASLARLQGTPKLFIESTDRQELDVATLRMYQIATPPKDHLVDSMTYSEMSDEGRRTYEDHIVSFFLQSLPPAGQPAQ
jgi:hypothetical protein